MIQAYFQFLFLGNNDVVLLRGPLWLEIRENRAVGVDFIDSCHGLNLKLATKLMLLFISSGAIQHIPLFNPVIRNLNTYFPLFFHVQGQAFLPLKTWEQEVFTRRPRSGRRQGWPLAPCLFSSALREGYPHFTPWQWPLVSCLTDRTWQPAQFSL